MASADDFSNDIDDKHNEHDELDDPESYYGIADICSKSNIRCSDDLKLMIDIIINKLNRISKTRDIDRKIKKMNSNVVVETTTLEFRYIDIISPDKLIPKISDSKSNEIFNALRNCIPKNARYCKLNRYKKLVELHLLKKHSNPENKPLTYLKPAQSAPPASLTVLGTEPPTLLAAAPPPAREPVPTAPVRVPHAQPAPPARLLFPGHVLNNPMTNVPVVVPYAFIMDMDEKFRNMTGALENMKTNIGKVRQLLMDTLPDDENRKRILDALNHSG